MARKTAKELLDEAEALLKKGRADLAAPKYRQTIAALGKHPSAVKVRGRLGLVLLRLGRSDEAARELKEVVRADPSPDNRYRLAQAHAFAGRHDEACRLLAGVLDDNPDHEPAIARTAALYQYIGRGDEAVALIDAAIARGLTGREIAHAFASFAIKHGRTGDAIDLLTPHAEDRTLSPDIRGEMLFSLGRLLDAAGEFDRAWAAYSEGNALARRTFDADKHDAIIDGIIDRFTPETIRSLAEDGDEGRRAILVVGMPRSGTTLIEQIIAAHPAVESGGELAALNAAISGIPGRKNGEIHPPLGRVRGASLRRARRSYLDALDAVSATADRVTDKMPNNFVHLGLVPAILPGAAVVHCRRDPRDTALSCYFRNFVSGNAFAGDLVSIARYTKAYLRLMRHWRATLPQACPAVPFVEVEYEAVSTDPEPNSKKTVEGVGLDWDDACLSFGKAGKMAPTLEPDQAGRGVYHTSVARWKRYEKHLAPFLEEMGDEADNG